MRGAAAYTALFERLARSGCGAFVPFAVVGDPDPATSLALISALAGSGAGALELGLPFSDPVADGPAIQAACGRALADRTRGEGAWRIVEQVRARHQDIPIGLLVHANLVVHAGEDRFFARAAEAGVDAVLVADAPLHESAPLERAANAHGVAPVLIAPPNASPDRLAAIAARSRGYVYVTSRPGVTGVHEGPRPDVARIVATLRQSGAPPPLLGFGIARPAHVAAALEMGAAGAICGSAIADRIERDPSGGERLVSRLTTFVH